MMTPDNRILQLAVDQSPSTIIVTDTEGRIEFVNPQFTHITGYAAEEVIGQRPAILKSGLVRPEIYEQLWSTITAGRTWTGIFCNRKKDGELFWEAAHITPVQDSEGRITHYLGIKEDITGLKKMEDELAHAGKLDWLSRMAAGLAHDFNNQLTSILGFGSPVQKALTGTRMGEDLGRVLSAAERASSLARNLYVLAARTEGRPETLDVNQTLEAMRPLLRHLLGPRVRLEFQPGELTEAVFLDPVELQQVVVNLLAGRLDASDASRMLTILTRPREFSAAEVSAWNWVQPGAFIEVEIADPKAVVAPAPAEHAGHAPEHLTGTPAAIRILRANGGFLVVEVDEDRGFRACIELPVAEQSEDNATVLREDPAEPAPAASILLVEDDPLVGRWLKHVLEAEGHALLHARSAEEAFDLLGDGSAMPSLVITDVSLPGMNGVAMVESLREVAPETRVIYMTGSSLPEGLPPGIAMLQKPFTAQEILDQVASLAQSAPPAILVVDDDDGIRELIGRALEEAGYRVTSLADGTDVEDEMERSGYDLVITDLVMPQREGLEVIQAVHRLYPNIPIVATSGAFGGYFLDVARKLGANEILTKPLRPEVLTACVGKLLARNPEKQRCH